MRGGPPLRASISDTAVMHRGEMSQPVWASSISAHTPSTASSTSPRHSEPPSFGASTSTP